MINKFSKLVQSFNINDIKPYAELRTQGTHYLSTLIEFETEKLLNSKCKIVINSSGHNLEVM